MKNIIILVAVLILLCGCSSEDIISKDESDAKLVDRYIETEIIAVDTYGAGKFGDIRASIVTNHNGEIRTYDVDLIPVNKNVKVNPRSIEEGIVCVKLLVEERKNYTNYEPREIIKCN